MKLIHSLQHRWSRGRSKERGYHAHAHNDADHDSEGTDYAADNSSDHSSSATQSPRHKPIPYGDSPLARTHLTNIEKRDSLSSQNDATNADAVRSTITAAQVHSTVAICHFATPFATHTHTHTANRAEHPIYSNTHCVGLKHVNY